MDKTIPYGTVRFVVRTGYNQVAPPLIGFAVTPLPEGALPGDCIEVHLLEDGTATWRIVEKQGIMSKGYDEGGGVMHHDMNGLFADGSAARACWPDLIEK